MGYLILYIMLITGAALIENMRPKPRAVKTKMGWLRVYRCSDFGITMRFEPFNRVDVQKKH